MARFPSFFGRGDDPFGSLFREVQKTFEDFSQRGPFAQFRSDMPSPKVDIAESKDAIEVTAELPGVDEKDPCAVRQFDRIDRVSALGQASGVGCHRRKALGVATRYSRD